MTDAEQAHADNIVAHADSVAATQALKDQTAALIAARQSADAGTAQTVAAMSQMSAGVSVEVFERVLTLVITALRPQP